MYVHFWIFKPVDKEKEAVTIYRVPQTINTRYVMMWKPY